MIELPRIGKNEMQAEPDPGRVQTKQLQAAIDALSEAGGGRLILQAGVYRTGALHLKSGVELHLASRDTLVQFVAEDPEQNYPLVFSHWEASPCYNYSPLLYACDAQDIAVTGEGVLDGGADADHWWNWHHQVEDSWSEDKTDLQLPDRCALRRMNLEGVPVEKRIFGAGHFLRPNFFQPIRCSRVLLQGVTLRNSPMWQLNPVMCQSVVVDGVTLSSHGANNDGCDPESCNGVWIKNCRFDTGDDCISLKSGRDRDGREANIPCQNILIENNDFADGHGGVALGSEMSGGIYNVLACDNHFASPNLTYALRLKTNARRGGAVERVMLCDSVMDHVHGAAVHGTMLYEDGRNGDSLPVFREITIENIKAHGGDYGIFLEAFPEVPITGLTLRNIEIDGVHQCLRSMNWKDAVVENVVINGKRFPRPGYVRILGVPSAGAAVRASAESCGAQEAMTFRWECSADGKTWQPCGDTPELAVRGGAAFVRVCLGCGGQPGTESGLPGPAAGSTGRSRAVLLPRDAGLPGDPASGTAGHPSGAGRDAAAAGRSFAAPACAAGYGRYGGPLRGGKQLLPAEGRLLCAAAHRHPSGDGDGGNAGVRGELPQRFQYHAGVHRRGQGGKQLRHQRGTRPVFRVHAAGTGRAFRPRTAGQPGGVWRS